MTFPSAPLESLGIIHTGSTPATSVESFWGGEIPFVTPAELDQQEAIQFTPRTLTESGAAQARVLKKDAVLVCCIGSLGKVGLAGRNLASNQQINAIEFDERLVFPKYGFYACQRLKPKLTSMAPATTVPIVNKSKFGQLEIPVPPLPEQRRIAAILDKADALRTKRREALAQLDRLAQSIFVEMFGDPSANPKGWKRKRLDELVLEGDSINYGVVQPGDDVDDGVPLVRVGDLVAGEVRHDNLKRISPEIERAYKRSRLKGDEILVSCVGSVGVVALASQREQGFNIARAVARIRVGPKVDREFVATQLGTAAVQRYFTQELRTVSQPTLNIKQISETQMICPPLELQREFASRVSAVRTIRTRLTESAWLTNTFFESVQNSAFKGALSA